MHEGSEGTHETTIAHREMSHLLEGRCPRASHQPALHCSWWCQAKTAVFADWATSWWLLSLGFDTTLIKDGIVLERIIQGLTLLKKCTTSSSLRLFTLLSLLVLVHAFNIWAEEYQYSTSWTTTGAVKAPNVLPVHVPAIPSQQAILYWTVMKYMLDT